MQPWLQAFLLAAMKFHCYVKELPLRAQADSQLAWLVIQRGIEYLSNLVKTRVQGACRRCQLPTCFCIFNLLYNIDCFVLQGHCLYKDYGRFGVRYQRPPERLQDYAGPMSIFASVMSAAWYVLGGSKPLYVQAWIYVYFSQAFAPAACCLSVKPWPTENRL